MQIESAEKRPRFKLKKWNAVAVWTWNTDIENCAICKFYLSELCPDCSGNPQENIRKCKMRFVLSELVFCCLEQKLHSFWSPFSAW